jgi:hypothetical protein
VVFRDIFVTAAAPLGFDVVGETQRRQVIVQGTMPMRSSAGLSFAVALAFLGIARAESPDGMFIVRSSAKAPNAVIADIKTYSEQRKWQYLGESKVKNGEVSLVKVCIPAVGQLLWPAGLHLSAMLPCGNIGVYRKGEVTEISVLHPRYMQMLYPHPATERASAVAQPLLAEMLDAVTRP